MVDTNLNWRFDNLPYRSEEEWLEDLRLERSAIMTLVDGEMYLKVNRMEFGIVWASRQDNGTVVNMHSVWSPTVRGDDIVFRSDWLCLAKDAEYSTLRHKHPVVEIDGKRVR